MEGWSVDEVCEWLETIGLGAHVAKFEDEGVDGELLVELDMEMLEELGISSKVQRKKLVLKRKKALELEQAQQEEVATSMPPEATAATSQEVDSAGSVKDIAATTAIKSTPTETTVDMPCREQQPAIKPAKMEGPPVGLVEMKHRREQQEAFAHLHEGGTLVLPARRSDSSQRQQADAEDGIDSSTGEHIYMQVGEPEPPTEEETYMELARTTEAPREGTYMELARTAGATEEQEKEEAPVLTQEDDPYAQITHADAHAMVQSAAMVNLEVYQQALAYLRKTFPQLPPNEIDEAYKAAKGDVDGAVESLLSIASIREEQELADEIDSMTLQERGAEVHSSLDWLHDSMSREESEYLLNLFGMEDGLFLVRPSSSISGAYVLSLAASGEVYHSIIYASANRCQMYNIVTKSLQDLIVYLSDFHPEESWFVPLTNHVPRGAREEETYSAPTPALRRTMTINAKSTRPPRQQTTGGHDREDIFVQVHLRSPQASERQAKESTPPSTYLPSGSIRRRPKASKDYKVYLQPRDDNVKLGFIATPDAQLIVLRVAPEALCFLTSGSGPVVARIPYNEIAAVDCLPPLVRLVVIDSQLDGVYNITTTPAESTKIFDRIEKNREYCLYLQGRLQQAESLPTTTTTFSSESVRKKKSRLSISKLIPRRSMAGSKKSTPPRLTRSGHDPLPPIPPPQATTSSAAHGIDPSSFTNPNFQTTQHSGAEHTTFGFDVGAAVVPEIGEEPQIPYENAVVTQSSTTAGNDVEVAQAPVLVLPNMYQEDHSEFQGEAVDHAIPTMELEVEMQEPPSFDSPHIDLFNHQDSFAPSMLGSYLPEYSTDSDSDGGDEQPISYH
eukprot:m.112890 g.112890  ORF g.112890 m.112890 type:complete len:844 (-) comp13494_c1_seq4:100-2631(-)